MKRTLYILLCVLLTLCMLAGCEDSEESIASVSKDMPTEDSSNIAGEIFQENSNITENAKQVVDIVLDGDGFDDALENFYEDDEYIYQFGCLMSDAITVYYSDGTTQNVKEALADGNIVITDLNKFGITYTRIPKDVSN